MTADSVTDRERAGRNRTLTLLADETSRYGIRLQRLSGPACLA